MVLQNIIPVKILGNIKDVVHAWEFGTSTASIFLATHFTEQNTKFGGGVQFPPSRQRWEQSVGVSFKKGSSFVQKLRQILLQ